MANRTLSENIGQAISDLNGVKQALINKGVEIPQGTPTSEFGAKIEEIQGGGGLDTSGITNFNEFCYNNRVPADCLDGLDTSSGTDFSYMFQKCTNLTTVPQLNTSNGTNFESMFSGCSALTSVPQLDLSSGTNFKSMFYNCALTTAPQLNTSSGTNFSMMFSSCKNLTELTQLDTSSGTNFRQMFGDCSALTEVPQMDFSKATNLTYMFSNCYGLTSVSQLDFSNATEAKYTFNRCDNLATVSNLTLGGDCSNMFFQCYKLTTVTGLNTDKVTNFATMFAYSSKLATVELTSLIANSSSRGMFASCSNLQNLTVTGTITVASNDSLDLSPSSKITVESLLSVLNALADNTGGTTYSIKLGATNLAKLTDEQKAIATNKNYTLA